MLAPTNQTRRMDCTKIFRQSLVRRWVGVMLCLTATACFACSKRTTQVVARANDDQAVMEAVKTFASDEGEQGREAWDKLSSHPRADLLSVLRRKLGDQKDRDRILASYIAFALCNLDADYEANRQLIVDVFNSSVENADRVEGLMARLIKRGDYRLLSTLFAMAPQSDGDLAEGLASTFGEQMQEAPERFHSELSRQPKAVKDSVCRLMPLGVSDLQRVRHDGIPPCSGQ